MFLFPLSSAAMLFMYLAALDIAWDKLSGGYLIGVALDIPLIVAGLSAIFIRNIPLAMLVTLSSVIVVASMWDLTQFYRLHAPISQVFVCLALSRAISVVRGHKVSALVNDPAWLYRMLGIDPIKWNWTDRADSLVNKSARIVDIASLVLFVVCVLFSIQAAVIGYTLIWLVCFGLYLSPILFIERAGKLFYSWRVSGGVDKAKDQTKKAIVRAQEKVAKNAQQTGAWIKSGFDSK